MSQEESPDVLGWIEFSTGSISGPNIPSHHQNQPKLDRSLEICFHRFYFHDLFSWNPLEILLKDLFYQRAIQENLECLDKIHD